MVNYDRIGNCGGKGCHIDMILLLFREMEQVQRSWQKACTPFPGAYTPLKDKGPEDIDFVVIRENTEGLYAGKMGYGTREVGDPVVGYL